MNSKGEVTACAPTSRVVPHATPGCVPLDVVQFPPAIALPAAWLKWNRDISRGRIMQSVVVTGASTGIGHACAKFLLGKGYRVFGSVRRQTDADRLTSEFGANFTPLLFDVTDEAAVLAAARDVRAALNGETLAGLVNNAGIAVT